MINDSRSGTVGLRAARCVPQGEIRFLLLNLSSDRWKRDSLLEQTQSFPVLSDP